MFLCTKLVCVVDLLVLLGISDCILVTGKLVLASVLSYGNISYPSKNNCNNYCLFSGHI